MQKAIIPAEVIRSTPFFQNPAFHFLARANSANGNTYNKSKTGALVVMLKVNTLFLLQPFKQVVANKLSFPGGVYIFHFG